MPFRVEKNKTIHKKEWMTKQFRNNERTKNNSRNRLQSQR